MSAWLISLWGCGIPRVSEKRTTCCGQASFIPADGMVIKYASAGQHGTDALTCILFLLQFSYDFNESISCVIWFYKAQTFVFFIGRKSV